MGYKMNGSPLKLWPWGNKRAKRIEFERGVGGEKIVSKKYGDGSQKKTKVVKYGEYGQRLSVDVTKYTKSGDVKSKRSKKYSQKRW